MPRDHARVHAEVHAGLQMAKEGLSQLWWTPTDCSGAVTWILLSNITYDITPPSLALLTTSGSTTKTVATSQSSAVVPSWAYSDTGIHQSLRRNARRLQFFSIKPASTSATTTYGANVVFSFSEPVTGFAEQYAFVKGGSVSDLNETIAQQQYASTVVADSSSTKSMLIMVTGSEFSSCPLPLRLALLPQDPFCFTTPPPFPLSSALLPPSHPSTLYGPPLHPFLLLLAICTSNSSLAAICTTLGNTYTH